ncbi:hypothetical protein E4T44_03215 [Aureobasidium sp. EXF-8845]|nr:hypothetical protein E4T44_03215 [Aureobasidium sp. EXF-8845]KAI4853108.1 hypothetical protein E4T45_04463 [Aureobasidium sp. EXF-8846]
MRSSIAVLAASAAGALAQSTSTKSLFLGAPSVAGQEWVGSVVTAGPSDTIYEITCTAEMCGTLSVPTNQQTITIGQTHLNYQFQTETMGIDASASETCKFSGTTAAVCQVTFDVNIEVTGVTSTHTKIVTTTSYSGSELAGVPVTLTAGVEKLAAATSGSGSGSGSSTAAGAASSSVAGSANAASTSNTSVSVVSSWRILGSRLTPDFQGASSTVASGRGGDVLALVMLSAVSVSVGALMML